MTQKKPTLGRGLADLLGQARTPPPHTPAGFPTGADADPGAAAASNPAVHGEELALLPVELLQRGRYQPRTDLRTDTLNDLADSIRVQGIIQPILVRPLSAPAAEAGGAGAAGTGAAGAGRGTEQRYEIIAGERRWRAATLAGLTEVPAMRPPWPWHSSRTSSARI
jgi:ParB family transcriptional regulator, chromosome partitioning protein